MQLSSRDERASERNGGADGMARILLCAVTCAILLGTRPGGRVGDFVGAIVSCATPNKCCDSDSQTTGVECGSGAVGWGGGYWWGRGW